MVTWVLWQNADCQVWVAALKPRKKSKLKWKRVTRLLDLSSFKPNMISTSLLLFDSEVLDIWSVLYRCTYCIVRPRCRAPRAHMQRWSSIIFTYLFSSSISSWKCSSWRFEISRHRRLNSLVSPKSAFSWRRLRLASVITGSRSRGSCFWSAWPGVNIFRTGAKTSAVSGILITLFQVVIVLLDISPCHVIHICSVHSTSLMSRGTHSDTPASVTNVDQAIASSPLVIFYA